MNSNIIAYIIYLSVTLYLIVRVGRLFYTNGSVFLLQLYKGNTEVCATINNLLLVAYYLFNTGYAFMKLKSWSYIASTAQLITSVSHQLSVLILILAVTHYFNMAVLYILSKRLNLFTS